MARAVDAGGGRKRFGLCCRWCWVLYASWFSSWGTPAWERSACAAPMAPRSSRAPRHPSRSGRGIPVAVQSQ